MSLIDTLSDTMQLVDLGSSYWFRSLARGPHGEALVLTYDGSLRVIDPETATVSSKLPVIGAWEEKDEWQQPGPILKIAGEHAYITDAGRGSSWSSTCTTSRSRRGTSSPSLLSNSRSSRERSRAATTTTTDRHPDPRLRDALLRRVAASAFPGTASAQKGPGVGSKTSGRRRHAW